MEYYSPETNLLKLIELVEATPEDAIDLDGYVSACGTLHCMAGLAATDPFFQAQGLTLETREPNGYPKVCFCVLDNSYTGHNNPHMVRLFGSAEIFNSYTDGPEFCGLLPGLRVVESTFNDAFVVGANNRQVSHKELALARLRYQLNKTRKGV
jgi:hypothetical protein